MSNGVVRQATFKEKVEVMSASRGWAKIGDGEYVASKFLSSDMPSVVNDPVMPVATESYETTTSSPEPTSIMENAKGMASDAMKATKDATGNAVDATKNAAGKAMDATKKAAGSATEKAKEAAGSGTEK